MLKLNSKMSKPVRTTAVVALALSQCWMLSACAKRATLAQTKSPTTNAPGAPAANDNKQTAPQGNAPVAPGAPTAPSSPNAPTPGKPGASNPSKPTAPNADPGQITFASSIEGVEADVDAAKDALRIAFSYSSGEDFQSIGPFVAKISDIVKSGATGVDLTPPVGVTAYSAHLSCKTAECLEGTLLLSKRGAPLEGQASVQILRSQPNDHKVDSVGTPKDVQAKVITALKTQGTIESSMLLEKVDKGNSFFRIECRVPSGAIVPGKPATEGQIVRISGQLGDAVSVSLKYLASYADKTPVEAVSLTGKAEYSDKDKSLKLTFKAADSISSLSFGTSSK